MLLKRIFFFDEPKVSNISLETGSNVTEQNKYRNKKLYILY